jgi:hypothetical protein
MDPRTIADQRARQAQRRFSLQEQLSRARGNYEKQGSEANYRALLEAQRAWDRLRIEELVAENRKWKQLVRQVLGRAKAALAEQLLDGERLQGERVNGD